ncbi:hypothetical protein Ait01nite_058240 [Actinoplanes italicus]|uniref:Uncharacterized protein DUF4037 n=1 Tax=Actinoplanes italicus TaxID=113567 RepID=A0A2T0K5Z2_9ACTN|nr:DUF4037 domain-containing protein [Actinoplanes italicus]PRX18370.1 uncharacterized protein DUF4037 [Actinoplanes italicus]GIE32779.1 hypothetical protein Ait01nite_058240 [Actinoplanes italicus]
MHPSFMPGLRLCRDFYAEAVRPLLDDAYPGLVHAAARVGQGSEVLGFDTPRSVDHDWGPRLELFLSAEDVERHGRDISALLTARLPKDVHGWPTNFEPPDARVRVMTATTGPVSHRVLVTDVASWSAAQLGFDARRQPDLLDWLATPSQRLAEAVGGEVFHDGSGELTVLRERLRWYPDDVWRYLLAAQWTRISQEEAFTGRAAEAGDELGSRVVAARLAREVMRLCLLLSRRFPPYSKWLGTAFQRLPGAEGIAAALRDAVETGDPQRRQAALCSAYEAAGARQNRLGIAEPVEATRRPYFDRPFPVIEAGRFADALRSRITDPAVAALSPIGGIDQYVDSTDTLVDPALCRRIMGAAGKF